MRKIFLFTCFVGFCAVAPAANQRGQCPQEDLQKKDCHFTLGENQIQIWNNKIFIKTKVARDLEPLPIQADAVEWSFVRVSELHGRSWLELGLWGPPAGEAAIESLTWTVYEIAAGKLVKHFEKIVQKRKKVSDSKYKSDKPLSYGLIDKKNKVYWQVGHDEGEIK